MKKKFLLHDWVTLIAGVICLIQGLFVAQVEWLQITLQAVGYLGIGYFLIKLVYVYAWLLIIPLFIVISCDSPSAERSRYLSAKRNPQIGQLQTNVHGIFDGQEYGVITIFNSYEFENKHYQVWFKANIINVTVIPGTDSIRATKAIIAACNIEFVNMYNKILKQKKPLEDQGKFYHWDTITETLKEIGHE